MSVPRLCRPRQFRSAVSLGRPWTCSLSPPSKENKEISNSLCLFCNHRRHQVSPRNGKTGQGSVLLLLKLKDTSEQHLKVHSLVEPVCSNSISIKHKNTRNTVSQSSHRTDHSCCETHPQTLGYSCFRTRWQLRIKEK